MGYQVENLNSYRLNEENIIEEAKPCTMKIVGGPRSKRRAVIELRIPAQLGKIKTEVQGKMTIPLVCPEKDCGGTHIWKDGYDYRTKSAQQLLQCAREKKKFYVHTSGYFEALATKLAADILNALIAEGVPLKALAERYHMSEASLSEAGREFRQYIFERFHLPRGGEGDSPEENRPSKLALRVSKGQDVGQIERQGTTSIWEQCRQEYLVPFEADQTGVLVVDVTCYAVIRNPICGNRAHYDQVAVMDETFLIIGGLRYYLIILVDCQGTIVSWGLSRTRTVEDLTAVFLEALTVIPFPGIFITDGLANYSAMLKQFPYPVIHIQHIHSHPYGQIVLAQRFIFWKETNSQSATDHNPVKELWSKEITLEVTTQVLKQPGLKQGYLLVKDKQHIKAPKRRGRPKGSTNRRSKTETQDPPPQESVPKKKRGRKKARMDGTPVDIHLTYDAITSTHHLTVDAPLPGFTHVPVFFLLWTLCLHFLGTSLGSNYVENVFSQFKRWFNVGRRTDLERFLHKFEAFTLCHNDRTRGTTEFDRWVTWFLEDHPPPSTVGFRNWLTAKPPPLPCI